MKTGLKDDKTKIRWMHIFINDINHCSLKLDQTCLYKFFMYFGIVDLTKTIRTKIIENQHD